MTEATEELVESLDLSLQVSGLIPNPVLLWGVYTAMPQKAQWTRDRKLRPVLWYLVAEEASPCPITPQVLCSCTVLWPQAETGLCLLCTSLRPSSSALSSDEDELWLAAHLPVSVLDCGLHEGRELWFLTEEVSKLPVRYRISAGRTKGWRQSKRQ